MRNSFTQRNSFARMATRCRKRRIDKGVEIMDNTTTQIAAEWIAKFDAAVQREDLVEMERIVTAVSSSPNRPFKREVLRQIGME